ncbi:MAG: hypothetical protein Q9185_004139 [Variospora sp. 1 TL-2023]
MGTPIHQPICREKPGGYDLLMCARLLTALKNLDYYYHIKIWGAHVEGDGHLPATFTFEDRQQPSSSCHLSLDLFEPGVPKTAIERFSLYDVHTDLNNIYFECLKKYGVGGFSRLGFLGNVAALLGPKLVSEDPWLGLFRGMAANGIDGKEVLTIDLTPLGDNTEDDDIQTLERALMRPQRSLPS